ncbi:MAG: hypothetical protein R6U70_11270 [Bacillota bacterium]
MRYIPLSFTLALLLIISGGCGYVYESAVPPGELEVAGPEEPNGTPVGAEEFVDLVRTAAERAREEGRFWYTGWVASFVGKRQINSMYDGTVCIPAGYTANVRIAGNPLRVFRWEGAMFIEERTRWRRVAEAAEVDYDPFAGLPGLFASASGIRLVGEEGVLSLPCRVYEGKLNGGEADDFRLWIAIETGHLMQYQVNLDFPLGGTGRARQEIFFRFYRHGDPGIEPLDVDKMEQYLQQQALREAVE